MMSILAKFCINKLSKLNFHLCAKFGSIKSILFKDKKIHFKPFKDIWLWTQDLNHLSTNKTLCPNSLMIPHNGLQVKRLFCSKIFATGSSELGNVACQIENQAESRTNQGDCILQVHTRQKNRTQPKTVWRDTKSHPQVKFLGITFDSQLSFRKHFQDTLDRCKTRYY